MPKTATEKSSPRLAHSQGGTTTRDDATDMGVPMSPGTGSVQPVGPEDALGVGPKRGDYTNRLGGSDYQPHQTVAVADPKEGEPVAVVYEQAPSVLVHRTGCPGGRVEVSTTPVAGGVVRVTRCVECGGQVADRSPASSEGAGR